MFCEQYSYRDSRRHQKETEARSRQNATGFVRKYINILMCPSRALFYISIYTHYYSPKLKNSFHSQSFFSFSPFHKVLSTFAGFVGAVNREKESREGSVPFLDAAGINSVCLFHSHPFYRQRDFCITLCFISFPLRNLPASLALIWLRRHHLC